LRQNRSAAAAVAGNHAKTSANRSGPGMAIGLTTKNPGSTLVFEIVPRKFCAGVQLAGVRIVRPAEMPAAALENRLSEECPWPICP
jgi:hypothetical protein